MLPKDTFSYRWLILPLLVASLVLYSWMLFAVPRTEATSLIGIFSGLFILYGALLWITKTDDSLGWGSQIIIAAVVFRVIAWVAFPSLSDDCYRFVWDGRMWIHGVNPFSDSPRAFLQLHPDLARACGLDEALLHKLNSPDFFTVYPAVMQGIFALGAGIFPKSIVGSVLVIKFFLLVTDLLNMWFISRLLKETGKPVSRLAWYALNPLVIVELVGNAHFESLMLTGMLGAWYLLRKEKTGWAGISFAVAIATKLVPLIFLPALLRRLRGKHFWIFYLVTGCVSLGSFFLILNVEIVSHLLESVYLYYHNFEFNASLWYLIREGAKHFSQDNLVETVGKGLAVCTLLSILLFVAREKQITLDRFPHAVMAIYLLFFLFAQAVHPWYVAPLVAWTLFSGRKFVLIWTALLPFTYLTYQVFPYQEPLWVAGGEYGLMLFVMAIEEIAIRRKNRMHLTVVN